MSAEIATLVLFGGMLFLLLLGIPVVFGIAAISLIAVFILHGFNGLTTLAMVTYKSTTSITLMAIPMFILMGNFLTHSGISDRLFRALNYWLSNIRGGLAIVAIAVCTVLAMCGGFGPGIITMGLIAVPAMLKLNYDKKVAVGTVMAGGVLGQVIPPSVLIIIFGFIAKVSIGKLYIAAFLPGFCCAILYVIYIIVLGFIKPEWLPLSDEKVSWAMRWSSAKEVVMPILLVFLVLGSIFLGVATPTEASAVGALGCVLICMIYRKLTWKVFLDSCTATLKTSGMAIWILVAASLFGMVYAGAGAQDMILGIVNDLEVNRWVILAGMQVILLILGCFMDDYAIVSICAPIFVPIAIHLGFDIIWFSIIFVLNMQAAYLSPPFGWSIILMKAIAPPEVTTGDIIRAVPPFLAMQLMILILVMIFPIIALWLPARLSY